MHIKCLCGYEYEDELTVKNGISFNKIVKGNEEFKEIKGNFSYVDKGDYRDSTVKLKLYLCPKCGTVRGVSMC